MGQKSSQKNRPQNKKRDVTLVLVLLLLFAFPVLVHHAFEEVKVWLGSGSGNGNAPGRTGPVAGYGGAGGTFGQSGGGGSAQGPGWIAYGHRGGYGAGQGEAGVYSGSRASLEALAQIEREQRERFLDRGAGRAKTRLEEGWVYVEPMPSRPSRYFPELPKPVLSSGVALSTSPAEPREPEKLGPNTWGQGAPSSEKIAENNWGKGEASSEKIAENNWGKGVPAREESRESTWGKGVASNEQPRESTWGQGTARQAPTPPPVAPVWPHPPQQTQPKFRAQNPPKARTTEQAKSEKLLEVCGRLVPESRAATAAMECAPKPAQGSSRKPASEGMAEGGTDQIFLP